MAFLISFNYIISNFKLMIVILINFFRFDKLFFRKIHFINSCIIYFTIYIKYIKLIFILI